LVGNKEIERTSKEVIKEEKGIEMTKVRKETYVKGQKRRSRKGETFYVPGHIDITEYGRTGKPKGIVGKILIDPKLKKEVLDDLESSHSRLIKARNLAIYHVRKFKLKKDRYYLKQIDKFIDEAQNKLNLLIGRIKTYEK